MNRITPGPMELGPIEIVADVVVTIAEQGHEEATALVTGYPSRS